MAAPHPSRSGARPCAGPAAPADVGAGGPPVPARLAEVSRLCALLAERALDAWTAGRPAPAGQTEALTKAAQLLEEYGLDRPPLIEHVLHEVVQPIGETATAPRRPRQLRLRLKRFVSRV